MLDSCFLDLRYGCQIGTQVIRILIVDDQPSVRKGLVMRLAAEPDLHVVGEAAGGQAALKLAASLSPDVVLMDIEMPNMDGIAATSALHSLCPKSSIIILSIHDDKQTCERAEHAGAAAFVPKSMPTNNLLATIRQVAEAHLM